MKNGWARVAVIAALAYAFIGLVPAATRPGRLLAWGLSIVVFLAHLLLERRRAQTRVTAAWHTTAAVMLATAVIALAAIVHNARAGTLRPGIPLAFIVWPAITGVVSFLVALLFFTVLPPAKTAPGA